jgi:hypothetical protein
MTVEGHNGVDVGTSVASTDDLNTKALSDKLTAD